MTRFTAGHERYCPGQEAGADGTFLIRMDFDDSEPGMIIHDNADVVEADFRVAGVVVAGRLIRVDTSSGRRRGFSRVSAQ